MLRLCYTILNHHRNCFLHFMCCKKKKSKLAHMRKYIHLYYISVIGILVGLQQLINRWIDKSVWHRKEN